MPTGNLLCGRRRSQAGAGAAAGGAGADTGGEDDDASEPDASDSDEEGIANCAKMDDV